MKHFQEYGSKMKKDTVFEGVCTALITPFKGDNIDFSAAEVLIERQISAGVSALVVCGTTGENSTLSDGEHRRMIRFTVDTVKGRVPVIAGTGSNDTRHACEMTHYATEVGADALLTVTPYYNKANEEGLYRSFKKIAESTNLPIILYNVPTRTCVDMSPELCARLCEINNIVGLKEASSSLEKIVYTRHLCKDKLDIYSGNDDLTLPVLSVGGKGVISVLSNLFPDKMCELWNAWLAGERESAAELQTSLSPLMRAMFCDVNPIPVKYAMSLLGLCREDVRLPLFPLDEKRKMLIHSLVYH